MGEIRKHPIVVAVIGGILLAICLLLLHPLKTGFIAGSAMILFYLVLLAIPLGNCLEMGVFAIVMTVVVTQIFGVLEARKIRKEKRDEDKVEQRAAPLPPAPQPGPSEGAH